MADRRNHNDPDHKTPSRRAFFRAGLLGAGAAGALTIVDRAVAVETEPAAGAKKAGYRETEHVKKVYALARF